MLQRKLSHFLSASAGLGASLKGLYTNVHSMGNREEELEFCMQLQGYDFSGIVETWWKAWWSQEVPEDWKKANATPIFKKFKKEPGELQAVSFHSAP